MLIRITTQMQVRGEVCPCILKTTWKIAMTLNTEILYLLEMVFPPMGLTKLWAEFFGMLNVDKGTTIPICSTQSFFRPNNPWELNNREFWKTRKGWLHASSAASFRVFSRLKQLWCLPAMLGHYDAGFTLRTYTHATRQKQDEAAQTMGSFMAQVM